MVHRRHAPDDIVVPVGAHEIQVRRRQDRHRHARAGQPGSDGVKVFLRQRRKLTHMPDGDPAAVVMTFGQFADVVHRHALGIGVEVEVEIDIDVEFPRHLEHPFDLAPRIAVGVGTPADHMGASLQRLDHQFVGTRIVQQAFLREHANFQIDGPGVFVNQRQHRFDALDADDRVDLEMRSDAGRALQDAFLEGPYGPAPNVRHGERSFCRRNFPDRLVEGSLLGLAAGQDASLVQMDV